MEKQIFYFNESSYLSKIESINRCRGLMQELLLEFNQLGIQEFKIDSIADLCALAAGGASWIKNKLVNLIDLGSLKLRPDQVDIPPHDRLNACCLRVAPHLNNEKPGECAADITYLTVLDSIVETDQTRLDQLRESYLLCAEDEVELEALEAHRSIVSALQKFRNLLPVTSFTPIKDLVLFNEDGTISPRYYYYHTRRGDILNRRYNRRQAAKKAQEKAL